MFKDANEALKAESYAGKALTALGAAVLVPSICLALFTRAAASGDGRALDIALFVGLLGLASIVVGLLLTRHSSKAGSRPLGPGLVLVMAALGAIQAVVSLPLAISAPTGRRIIDVVLPSLYSLGSVALYYSLVKSRRRRSDGIA